MTTPASHPTYAAMVSQAVSNDTSMYGITRPALKKFLKETYGLEPKANLVARALRAGVAQGMFELQGRHRYKLATEYRVALRKKRELEKRKEARKAKQAEKKKSTKKKSTKKKTTTPKKKTTKKNAGEEATEEGTEKGTEGEEKKTKKTTKKKTTKKTTKKTAKKGGEAEEKKKKTTKKKKGGEEEKKTIKKKATKKMSAKKTAKKGGAKSATAAKKEVKKAAGKRGRPKKTDTPAAKETTTKKAGGKRAKASVAAPAAKRAKSKAAEIPPLLRRADSLHVLPQSGLSGEVYRAGTVVFEANLAVVNIDTDTDNFFKIQIVKTADGKYHLVTVSGRTGTRGECEMKAYDSADDAVTAFEAVFVDKTGATWADRNSYVAEEGKYSLAKKDHNRIQHGEVMWKYYMDNGVDGKADGWYDYAKEASEHVEATYQEFKMNKAWLTVRSIKSGHFSYHVNFSNMSQTNLSTKKTRKIQRFVDGQMNDEN